MTLIMTTLNEKSGSGNLTTDIPEMILSSSGVESIPHSPSFQISSPTDGKTDLEPVISGSPPTAPHGLADQTNFLPVKQLLGVFAGLSTALACSFLDQTMLV
jgi:hypothetical protein